MCLTRALDADCLIWSCCVMWFFKIKGHPKMTCFVVFWSGKRDSNSRPQPWQGCALPTELFPHFSSKPLFRLGLQRYEDFLILQIFSDFFAHFYEKSAKSGVGHPLFADNFYKSTLKLVFLLLFHVCLQEFLLYIGRYRLVVSEVHCEGCATRRE